jgi:hypothetical protein
MPQAGENRCRFSDRFAEDCSETGSSSVRIFSRSCSATSILRTCGNPTELTVIEKDLDRRRTVISKGNIKLLE